MSAQNERLSDCFKSAMRRLGGSFLDLCLPRLCAGCRKIWLLSHEGFWCEGCFEELPWIRSPLCPRCGRPFLKSASSNDHLCGDCLLGLHPFDTARSATTYSGIVRQRIHQLKFGAQLHWVPALVELLALTFHREGLEGAEVILPVPLHVKRLRQRGFNQVGLLAKALGRRIGLSVQYDSLVRKHWTEPQTRLNRQERLENVKDAFLVVHGPAIEGKCALLIDDVFTTGTTVNECTKTLKNAGAREVHALTIARALPELKTDRGIDDV